MSERVLVDWDGRPAVLFSVARGEAMALLERGAEWVSVDADDVFSTGRVVSDETALRARFASTFGGFTVPLTFRPDFQKPA
ncbi:hypothetical protein O4H61_03235 [Roseovarius aestuarii]|nr:hypothetical protein [Roseovarius aestuarii]